MLSFASRHPSNNKVVQEILRRAAWNQSDVRRFKSLLRAAHTVAALDHAVTGEPLSPSSSWKETSRIVRETLQDDTTTCDPVNYRSIPFDEVELHRVEIRKLLHHIDEKLLLEIVGPHRRGAPFSKKIHCLITQLGSERAYDDQYVMFDKVTRFLKKLPYCVKCAVVNQSNAVFHVRHLPINPQHENHCVVSLRWTTFDRYFAQVLLATGPVDFNTRVMTAAGRAGFSLTDDGLFHQERGCFFVPRTEVELFEMLHIPFQSPSGR